MLADTKHEDGCITSTGSSFCAARTRPCWLVPLLPSHASQLLSRSAQSRRLTIHQHCVAYGLPSRLLGQSIHASGSVFICGIHQEPSIDFLPSLCHQSALPCPWGPSPLEPRDSRASSQQAFAVSRHTACCCGTGTAPGVSRPPNAHGQICHARNHAICARRSSASRLCIHAPSSISLRARSPSAGHVCICILRALSSSR